MLTIRDAVPADLPRWSAMRMALWPDSNDEHETEIRNFFAGESIDIVQAYMAEIDSKLIGFMELNIRNFAEGSRRSRVPYVEAWYVEPVHQNRGYGRQLMQKAEQWARACGFDELASDTDVANARSIALHLELGFEETERVVCFIKRLR